MCGIAGLIARTPVGPAEEARVRGMLETLQHRGPDGFGQETRGCAVLGHARLAIIDLHTGDQPQSDQAGRYWVVCNGEIYNYQELRAELESRGHVFRTQSDIEVIPHLYEEMGDACVEKLRGMFAFALHDLDRERTLLARDRLGKKPLCYAVLPDAFAFASEPRALAVLDGVDLTPDLEAVDLYLTWQYVPAPWTIHRGIRKLPPASVMSVERDGRVAIRRYWDPIPTPEADLGMDGALGQLDATIREASRIRLRSDVPVSTFLSGGIDSGLVVSYLAEEASEALAAVTVGFANATEDERSLTRLTAKHVGLRLEEEVLDLDVLDVVEQVVRHMDEPLGDASCVPTWLVSKVAADRVKVVISGDGGDESFAGYATRYSHNRTISRLRRILPRILRRSAVSGAAKLWPKDARLPRFLRLSNVLRSLSLELEDAYALDMSIFRPELKDALYAPSFKEQLDGFDARCILDDAFKNTRGLDPVARLLHVDRHTYLAEGVIPKVDRMSMAPSLEVRSPLLDQEVVELACRIPTSLKLDGGTGKLCLRKLAERRLPREVVHAKKAGFAPPLSQWMRGPLADVLRDRLTASDSFVGGFLDRTAVTRLVDEHLQGRRDRARPLWLLLVLETWAASRTLAGVAT